MTKSLITLALIYGFGTIAAFAVTDQTDKSSFNAQERESLLTESDLYELAFTEVEAGRISKAIEHERRAMQMYSAKDVAAGHSPLGYADIAFILALSSHHAREAETLLRDAVKRTQDVAGSKSVLTRAQIADLFVFYLRQKNYSAALRTLEQVLDFDLSSGPTPTQALRINQNIRGRVRPYTAVAVLHEILSAIQANENSNPGFSITAVGKILKAQDDCLEADDERLVETLAALADAYFYSKEYKEADVYYSRAYKIADRYHPESSFAVHQCGQNFLDNLKEVGRSEEAVRLSRLKEGM
jgi:tetratricopeptide (TPR) repeat protein